MSNVFSHTANSRGIKIQGCLRCFFDNLKAFGSVVATGISITDGTRQSTFNNLQAWFNFHQGVWFSDQSNIQNVLSGVVARLNGENAGEADIQFFTSDGNNVLVGAIYDVLTNGGTGNVISANIDL